MGHRGTLFQQKAQTPMPTAQGQVTVSGHGPLLQGDCQVVIMHGTWFSFSTFQLGLESVRVPCHLLYPIIILHQAAFLKCGSPRIAGER